MPKGGIAPKGLIIMTRTIITAAGTRLRDETLTRRIIRRAIFATLAIIGLIFLSAAIIGITHPATHTQPKGNSDAQSVADFNDGWETALSDIRDLSRRPARSWVNPDGSKASDPNGMALLQECLSDSSLTIEELHICIDAPAN